MTSAYETFSQRRTPQREAIPGEESRQQANNAGGFVYGVNNWKALERFLILGSEGGTYYVGEKALTKQNALRTMQAITDDPKRAIDLITQISVEGRAPKNDPAIFALALAASSPDPQTRALALAALPKVCRIPTHLFHFLTYVQAQRGWGRGLRRAVAAWYTDQSVDRLAYQVTKYQSRDGWSNADALRKSHPRTLDPTRQAIFRWIVDGLAEVKKRDLPIPGIVAGFELAKDAPTKELVQLVKDYNLSREMLPTEALKKPEVWEALLEKMPPEAMIRNLGNLSKSGLLMPLSAASTLVVDRLHDVAALKKARIHPLQVLVAMKTYQSGHGVKGVGTWVPVPAVVDALDDAFYLCFSFLEPTGKRLLFGVDVSGSMSSPIGHLNISCAEGAAAMALACAKTEREYYVMGFTAGSAGMASRYIGHHFGKSHLDGFVDLGITSQMRLTDALRKTRGLNFGATDCALPMLWAEKNKIDVDGFIILTDNETWAGPVHPKQALKQYRESRGIQAKEIVVGMTATQFTIADPEDPLTLDVVGFDTSVPQVMQEFLR